MFVVHFKVTNMQKITFYGTMAMQKKPPTFTLQFLKTEKLSALCPARVKPMGFTLELDGQRFIAFNGGPMFKFTEAVSMFVNCETQDEIDYYWERLSEGGQKSRCSWIERQIWFVMANCTACGRGIAWRRRPRKSGACNAGNAADG